MFKTVLWATDGSETAARALPFALALAEPDKAKLVVAHAHEIFVGRGGGFPVLADEPELRAKIASQVEELRTGGLDATFIVRTCTRGPRRAHDRGDRRGGRGRPDRRRHARLRTRRRTPDRQRHAGPAARGRLPRARDPDGRTGRDARARARDERHPVDPAGKPQHGSVPAPMLRLLPRANLEASNNKEACNESTRLSRSRAAVLGRRSRIRRSRRRRTSSCASTPRRSAAPTCTS